MAEVKNYRVRQTTMQTTSSLTYVPVPGTKILGSALDANTKYLVRVKAQFGGDNNAQLFYLRVVTADDALIATKSEIIQEPGRTSNNVLNGFFFRHSFETGATPQDIELEFKIGNSGDEMRVDQVSIHLVDLDDLGPSNYFETIDADANVEVTTTPTSKVQIAGSDLGTDEWLIEGYFRMGMGSATRSFGVRLDTAQDASSASTVNSHFEEGEDTAELRVVGIAARHKASSGTPNADILVWEEHDAANMFERGGYMIALKASAFKDGLKWDYNAGSVLITSSETDLASVVDYTPSTATNHIFVGVANCADVDGNSRVAAYVENGVGTNLMPGDEVKFQTQGYDSTDEAMAYCGLEESLPASEDTFFFRSILQGGGNDRNFENRWLLILNLEKAAAAAPLFPRRQQTVVRM